MINIFIGWLLDAHWAIGYWILVIGRPAGYRTAFHLLDASLWESIV
ncbi:MAG: hypothetical protein IKB40_06620 [Paludibacteraceae bacterium]|nr:hypothetical protein [Paludibacteraceae bacterium]